LVDISHISHIPSYTHLGIIIFSHHIFHIFFLRFFIFSSHVFPWFPHGFLEVMGLSGGTNTFELSGDVRDPTAVVLARIRKAQFAAGLRDGKTGENGGKPGENRGKIGENRGNPLRNDGGYGGYGGYGG
jgi:hypothetical protein